MREVEKGDPQILCVNHHKPWASPRVAYALERPENSTAKALTTALKLGPLKQKIRQNI